MSDKHQEFSKIYDKYIDKIFRFIFLKVSSQEITQDLCSETFLRGWQSFQAKEIDNPQAFLYQIARNLVVDHYREKGKAQQVVSADSVPIIDPRPNIEEKAALISDMEQVKAVLASLKDDYQNVVIWHYLDDISIPDIAKIMNKSEEATRVTLHRALKALKQGLGGTA